MSTNRKPMECVKTGCVVWSVEYECYLLGDLYFIGNPLEEEGQYVLKGHYRNASSPRDRVHMWANAVEFWDAAGPGAFDVTFILNCQWFSYEGKSLIEAFKK